MLGVDYSSTPPGGGNIKAAGFDFACRYISHYSAKNVKAGEFNDLKNNDVGLVVVFEDGASRVLGGYDAGAADAKYADDYARGIGWPDDRPIYFAVDFDISDAQKPTAGEYFKGVASLLGLPRTGGYGGYYLIKYLFDNNLITYGWQAVAWSGGNIDPRAHIFQRLGGTTVNGTACDINDALQTDFGQSNFKGDEMITNDDTDILRITHSEIGGVNFDEIHSGKDDDNLRANWVGKTVKDLIRTEWNSDGAKNFRAVRNQDMTQYPALQEQNTQLTKDKADLQAKLDAVSGDPNNVIITAKGWSALYAAIKSFFNKNN